MHDRTDRRADKRTDIRPMLTAVDAAGVITIDRIDKKQMLTGLTLWD